MMYYVTDNLQDAEVTAAKINNNHNIPQTEVVNYDGTYVVGVCSCCESSLAGSILVTYDEIVQYFPDPFS